MASRTYEKWEIEQDKELLDLYAECNNFQAIADKFGRSCQAIKLRLEHMWVHYYKTDMINNKDAVLLKYYEKSKPLNKLAEENLKLKRRIETLEKQLNDPPKSI
jgi:hypothetical protein